MTINEFLKLYPLPENDPNLVVKKAKRLVECVQVKSVYNQMLNALRSSLQDNLDYLVKATEIWSRSVYSDLEKAQSDETIKQAVEKSKITKELLKRGYKVEAELSIIPVTIPDVNIHHYNVYVKFYADVEALYLYWKNQNVMRKVFISVEDGIFHIKYPPYNLKDDSPYGFLGVSDMGDTLVICE